MRAITLYACQGEALEELSFGVGEFINKVNPDIEPGRIYIDIYRDAESKILLR